MRELQRYDGDKRYHKGGCGRPDIDDTAVSKNDGDHWLSSECDEEDKLLKTARPIASSPDVVKPKNPWAGLAPKDEEWRQLGLCSATSGKWRKASRTSARAESSERDGVFGVDSIGSELCRRS